ncbi:MAG: enoyl-CoA hydratase/isomerase family protein, partial [Chloroflexi bacterium]|nr:enoyl-CoA hydratase/isomerase family protein [Chloroflexota bacterium]
MPYELLLTERRDKVALVTLNRPDKRNALSIALRNEIDQCL